MKGCKGNTIGGKCPICPDCPHGEQQAFAFADEPFPQPEAALPCRRLTAMQAREKAVRAATELRGELGNREINFPSS